MKSINTKIMTALCMVVLFPCISNAENLFKEGTEWFCIELSDVSWPLKIYNTRYYFQGTINQNDKTYLIIKEEIIDSEETSTYRTWGAIRSEGEKVYYLPENCSEEVLLYNFEMTPGESYQIFPGNMNYQNGKYPNAVQIELIEDEMQDSEYGQYQLMKLQETNSYGQCERPTYWINGIGSIAGPINNTYADMLGIGATVTEVKVDGNTVYKRATAGITDFVYEEEGCNQKAYNIDGTLHKKGEKGIYIVNGKKKIDK